MTQRIGFLLLLFLSVLLFASCSAPTPQVPQEPPPPCEHVPVKVNGTPASCTAEGLSDGEICSLCDAVLTKQQPIPKAQHALEPSGEHEAACDTCGASFKVAEGLHYRLNEDGASYAVGYGDAIDTVVVLPSVYDGRPVTSIYAEGFSEANITSVVIPDSVTHIGYGAFMHCSSLVYVRMSSNLEHIAYSTFEGCTALQTNRYDETHYLGNRDHPYTLLLQAAATDITACHIHEDTRILGVQAFQFCEKLTSITLPEGLACIGSNAFANCTSLQQIAIPSTVTDICDGAFSACSELTDVSFAEEPLLRCLEDGVFSSCGKLAAIHLPDTLTSLPIGLFLDCISLREVTLPAFVEHIGGDAFAFCEQLTEITLPDTVKSIGANAFAFCSNLERLHLPDTLLFIDDGIVSGSDKLAFVEYDNALYIGSEENPHMILVKSADAAIHAVDIHAQTRFIHSAAFAEHAALERVSIPSSVSHIGFAAFADCTALGELTFAEDAVLVHIGESAFRGTPLTSVQLPDALVRIGASAFADCKELQTLSIGPSVCNIDAEAFEECTKLTAVYIRDLAAWCRIDIGDAAMPHTYALFVNDVPLTDLIVPDGITHLNDYAFSGCTSLVSVRLPDGLVHIGSHAFSFCTNLEEIVLPDDVVYMGYEAFSMSRKLTRIIFGGTRERWDAMYKEPSWNYELGEYTVTCTDDEA